LQTTIDFNTVLVKRLRDRDTTALDYLYDNYSDALFGEQAWTATPSAPLTGAYAAEGPSVLKRDGELFVYFDKYGEGTYGALRATGAALDTPAGWEDVSDSVFFPGVRHGTPIEVPWEVFEAVALRAGE